MGVELNETRIWAIEKVAATPLPPAGKVEAEVLLEDILVANPSMLEEHLVLVGRQTPAAGGRLDLLGVERNGRLVVFELKRGKLSRDAVAQAVDYASDLNSMELDELSRHIQDRSGHQGIEKIPDFDDWYSEISENVEMLIPPRMVLVGLGADERTERMVEFMAGTGMDISLLTFHGFESQDGKTLLARTVDVDSHKVRITSDSKSRSRRAQAKFQEHVDALTSDLQTLLSEIDGMFRDRLRGFHTHRTATRINFRLDYLWQAADWRYRSTFFIEVEDNVCVGLYPSAIGLMSADDRGELEKQGFKRAPTNAKRGPEEVDYEIGLQVNSRAEWNARKARFGRLVEQIHETYQSERHGTTT